MPVPPRLADILMSREEPDPDWFGSLPRNRDADPEAYRAPSPPSRDLPFPGTAYLPEEFLAQTQAFEPQQEPTEGRLPTPRERAAANQDPIYDWWLRQLRR